MKRVHESKRDVWIVALLWGAVAVMIVGAVNLWRSPTPFAFRLLMSVLFSVSAILVMWVLYGTRYTLTEGKLIVQSGPFRWVIELDSITEVFPTRNPLSSPACSLDRLHIRYRQSRQGIMISPEDKAAFLQDLVVLSPGLTLDGDRMVRND
jgi:hypothetical protein